MDSQFISFQPAPARALTPPAPLFAAPPASAGQSLGWLSAWQPPVPPRSDIILQQYSIAQPTEFALFPYVDSTKRPDALTRKPFAYATVQALVEQAPQPLNYVAPVIPPHTCDLTLANLQDRLAERLDDPLHIYYSLPQKRHALNMAQNLWALVTLCIERTATFTLTNGVAFYKPRTQLTDYLVPLRVLHSGSRLNNDSVHNFDAMSDSWRATAGNPERYATLGFDALWITPQPASGSHTLTFIYAAEPAQLVNSTDIPEIPNEQLVHIEDIAYFLLRLPEGGQEMAAAMEFFKRGVAGMQKYQKFVRNKTQGQVYDTDPLDEAATDIGRWVIKLPKQPSATGPKG